MKTLKTVEPKQIVTWSLVIMFSFLQIVPTGWAATRPVPVDELQARSVPGSVDALANTPAATQPAPAPQTAVVPIDSIAFQVNDNPLSPSTSEPIVVKQLPTDPGLIPEPKPVDPGLTPEPRPVDPGLTPEPRPVDPGLIPEPKPIDPGLIPEPRPTLIPPAVVAVKADLVKNLGIDARQLEAWLKEGLVKIAYDAAKGTVTVSFSEQLRSQYDGLKNVNLFDPTGASGLPKSIEYHYVNRLISEIICSDSGCSRGGNSFIELDSARITNWDGTVGVAKYSNGTLQQVDWYRHYREGEPRPMIACRVGDLACGMVLDRTVTYDLIASIPEDPNPAHLLVTVVYHDGRAISKLEFEIGNQLGDGKDHILNVREYGKDGKWLATNKFNYTIAESIGGTCVSDVKCVPPSRVEVFLDSIVRTDANGKLLSTIRNIRKTGLIAYPMVTSSDERMPPIYLGNYTGDVVLADGKIHQAIFNDLSNLLEQARKIERENAIPPAVQAYVDTLKSQLGKWFLVKTTLQNDGTYLVTVGRVPNPLVDPMPGSLSSLEFSLSQDGVLNEDSIKANYNGAGVDAKLVFEGMLRLQNYCPPGMDCIALYKRDPQQAILDMTRINVNNVDATGAVHFEKDGKFWKVYRDSNGIKDGIKLEEELPPAVQAYVNELKNNLGKWFSVTATIQDNGTYLVKVGRVPNPLADPIRGSLFSLEFNLNKDGVVNEDSIKADYDGRAGVDAKLVFEGMLRLQNYCPPGMDCIALYRRDPQQAILDMTRINVSNVGATGAVHFEKDGKQYKVYRDASGNVILEQENTIPPAVQVYVDALKQQLGNGFSVTATLQSDGTYFVKVGRVPNPLLDPMPGSLSSLEFSLSQDGVLNEDSIKVDYNGLRVDAKLVFEGMLRLQNYCFSGMDCINLFRRDPFQAILDMTRINVSNVDATGALHFTKDGKHYKVYRDANGNVVLEEELPPAVQAYVDTLKSQLGKWFSVTTTLQTDGTYLVKVDKVSNPLVDPMLGSLSSLEFSLSNDGVLNEDSIKADYDGVRVDSKLVFEGMLRLQNYCPPGMDCIALYKRDPQQAILDMTRINVSSVDRTGAAHFTKDGKHYKVYRDAIGNVILEQENTIPSAVQAYIDALRQQLGNGFSVTATLQKDGTYLVSVGPKEATIHTDIRLLNLSFELSAEGVVNPTTVKATYGNNSCDSVKCLHFVTRIIEVDGQLLWGAMSALEASFHPEGSHWMIAIEFYTARLVQLATQIVLKESGENLIRFDQNGKSYKAYRDANGSVVLEQETVLPPWVQAYVNGLQNWIGTGYVVHTTLVGENTYRIDITLSGTASAQTGEGRLTSMSFVLRVGTVAGMTEEHATFNIDTSTIQATYAEAVDASLLFEGINWLQYAGQGGQKEVIALMTQITVDSVDSNGRIHFTKDGAHYQTYRDANGKIIADPELPPAVQAYVDALREKLVSLWGTEIRTLVGVYLQGDGTYKIHATKLCDPVAGDTVILQFVLAADGTFHEDSLRAWYIPYDPALNAPLLFEGMKLLQPGANDQDALVLMTKISVNSVDSNGAIHFIKDGVNYQVYRNTNGNVVLVQQIILPSEILQAAQAHLSAAEWTQLNAAMLDVGRGSTYSIQTSLDGRQTAWVWTNADGKTTYKLDRSFVGPTQEERWFFSASIVVPKSEVEQAGAQLPEHIRVQVELVLSNIPSDTIFTKRISGNDVSYTWEWADEKRSMELQYQTNSNEPPKVSFTSQAPLTVPSTADLLPVVKDSPIYLGPPLVIGSTEERHSPIYLGPPVVAHSARTISPRIARRSTAFTSANSLRPVSTALNATVLMGNGDGTRTNGILGVENGSLISSRILAELTR